MQSRRAALGSQMQHMVTPTPRPTCPHGARSSEDTPHAQANTPWPGAALTINSFGLTQRKHHPPWSLFPPIIHRHMTHKQSETPSDLPESSLQGQSSAGKNRLKCLLQGASQSRNPNVPRMSLVPGRGVQRWQAGPILPAPAFRQMPPKATPATSLPSSAVAGPLK